MERAYAQHYRELWNRHWWWRARRRFVLGLIDEIRQTHEVRSILDIGCGDGLFFDDLMAIAPTWGIEPDGRLLTDANPYRERIEVGPFGETGATARRYDLVVMLDVMEHIEDDHAAAATLAECLEPRGYAVLTVPALGWLWSQHDEANHHFRRYSRDGLKERLVQAGLIVERCDYYFSWTIGPLLLRKWLQPAQSTHREHPEYQVSIPPPAINRLMQAVSEWEHAVARRVRLPIGSSLFAVCRRS